MTAPTILGQDLQPTSQTFASTVDITVTLGSNDGRWIRVLAIAPSSIAAAYGAGYISGAVLDPGGAAVALTLEADHDYNGGSPSYGLGIPGRVCWFRLDSIGAPSMPTGTVTLRVSLVDGDTKPIVHAEWGEGLAVAGSSGTHSNGSGTSWASAAMTATANDLVLGIGFFDCGATPSGNATVTGSGGTTVAGVLGQLAFQRGFNASKSAVNPTLTATIGNNSFTPAWFGRAWVLQGTVTAPVITGPTGAAGAGSITTSAAENQNVAGVWTATNSVSWSLSGTDAGLLSISGGTVTKASGNFDYDVATGGKTSYSFTVNNGSASQAVTLNINDVNEAPSFIGPAIGSLVLTQGVAMTPVDIAAKFTDPEGLGITASVVESLPAGLSVVSGILQGTPSVVQGSASYTPRGADPASNGTNGTAFTITVLSPVPALSAPAASATGTTTATAGFTTSLAGGNAFFLRRTGASPASQATVAATGESQAVSASGAQTRNMTGFTTGTPFYVDMTQTGASDVVSAGPFTPSTMTTSGSPSAQSGTAGAAFSYTGGTPASFISGGIGTKTWSLISAGGSGLSSVNPSTGVPAGTLTGTPGTYSPVLRVTDSSTAGINPTGGGTPPQTIDFTLTLIVGASGAATALVISNASPANGQVGQLSNDFTVGANGTITGTVAVTPNAGAGGGSFVPSSVNISSGSPTGTFKYLPASTGAKSIGVTNNGGLTNPSTVTYTATPALATTLSVTLTTDGITPLPNLTGLKVAVYDQPTPDLWAGNPPIYATAAGSTDAFGVLTCNITGLTTLVPGGLAGLSISNSDGTLTQGAAQRGYVGPAAVS